MNVQDIRPSCSADCCPETAGYHAMTTGKLTRQIAETLLPERATLAMVWRYLAAASADIEESPICLCRKIVRWTGKSLSLGQLMTCLDIFRDVGLLDMARVHKNLHIRLTPGSKKADLTTSQTMQRLLRVKES